MPIPTPNGDRTFVDPNGNPISGGTVYSYVPGTTNPSPTYQDEGLTIQNPNPVTLDQAGRCVMWTGGLIRQVAYDMFGNLQWDQETGFSLDPYIGNLTIEGNLTVDGQSTFNGNTQTNGNAGISGSLSVGGGSNLAGGANVTGGLTADSINDTGPLTVAGTTDLNGALNVAGLTSANGGLDTTNLNDSGNANIAGNLDVGGNAQIDGNLNVNGTITGGGGGGGQQGAPQVLAFRTVTAANPSANDYNPAVQNPISINYSLTDAVVFWNPPYQAPPGGTPGAWFAVANVTLPANAPAGQCVYLVCNFFDTSGSAAALGNYLLWARVTSPGGFVYSPVRGVVTNYWPGMNENPDDPTFDLINYPQGTVDGGVFELISIGGNNWIAMNYSITV